MDEVDGSKSSLSCYEKGRGFCYIINNEKFSEQLKLNERKGSNEDLKSLNKFFTSLNFDVEFHTDCTAQQMYENLRKIAAKPKLKEYSIFICIILSHGENGVIYGTDRILEIDRLISLFKGNKCPALINKPKIFIIQACRGDKYDKGGIVHDAIDSSPTIEKVPIESDILMCYSTVSGYYSWRNSGNGSWYIQSFCEMMEKYCGKEDFLQILVRVNNKVSTSYQSNTNLPKTDNMVQSPSFVCMLRKQVFLK